MSEVDRPTVMVTGGAGYIGSHAVLALADRGWPCVVLDDLRTGFRSSVPAGVPLIQADVADEAAVGAAIATHGVGAVLHFAGSLLVEESVRNPLRYYANNVGASAALFRACTAAGVGHIVFSSSAATYGVPATVPIPEDAAQRPINPYGRTKLMVEEMLADLAATGAVNYCALRYFNVAGADPAGRSGQSTKGATHLIHVAAEAVAGRRAEVAIYGEDYPTADGTCVRDYIHVSDLADAHVLALEALIADPAASHALNVGYGTGYSVREVLDAVDRVAGRTIPRRPAARRPGDPAALVADPARIKALFGWQPRLADIDTIVADALRWEREGAARQT